MLDFAIPGVNKLFAVAGFNYNHPIPGDDENDPDVPDVNRVERNSHRKYFYQGLILKIIMF